MRYFALVAMIFILTGCRPVQAPPPAVEPPTPMAEPTATPTAEPDTADLQAAYQGFIDGYNALNAHMEAMAFEDAAWRAETVRLAQEWQAQIETLRNAPHPTEPPWDKAWPVLVEALDDLAYSATAAENAAAQNNKLLLLPTYERTANAANLLQQFAQLVSGD